VSDGLPAAISTFITPEQKYLGIDPDKMFEFSVSDDKESKFWKEDGMVLVRAFEERYSELNDVRDPRKDGRDPTSLLLLRAR